MVGAGAGSYGTLFDIREGASLELTDLIIRVFDSEDTEAYARNLLFNAGQLALRDVRIEHISSRSTVTHAGNLIENAGELNLDRVRFADFETVSLDGMGGFVLALHNTGEGRLQNVFMANGRVKNLTQAEATPAYILNLDFAPLDIRFSTLTASIILDLGCPVRRDIGGGDVGGGDAASGGHNFISADGCFGAMAGGGNDRIGNFSNVAQLRMEPDGGASVLLPYFSWARDRVPGSGILCPARDAVGTRRPLKGVDNGVAACDVGAFDVVAGSPLFAGGENGLIYTQGQDGHYVTVQEVRPQEYVIYWNTFDLDGNQAWVLGVGQRAGGLITAEAYYQPQGRLIAGGGAEVNTNAIQDWGTIRIQLDNCLEGEFSYASRLPQFGEGNFHLDRLGLVNDLGCSGDAGQ